MRPWRTRTASRPGRGDTTKTLAMEAPAASEHALLTHIGERDRGEIEVDLIAKLFPEIVRGAAGPIATATDRRAGGTACRADRLVDGKDRRRQRRKAK